MDGKWNREEVHRLLANHCTYSQIQIKAIVGSGNKQCLNQAIRALADKIQKDIINETLFLPAIQYKTIIDANSGKTRIIGRQSMIHQIYDYIAVNGLMELFNKKITAQQCASLPGRGQHYGKKMIEKWRRCDGKHMRKCIQADVYHCYPSIKHDILKKKLIRDVKNQRLLWLTFKLIGMFKEGLSIGSYLSQFLCNYLLSYVSHFINEKLYITRKSKGKERRVNLVKHSIIYMDDILIFGSNMKHLHMAMKLIINYLKTELGLDIKPSWRAFATDYIDRNGRRRGSFIDTMGFRIYCDHTTIRQKIFKRIRRRFARIKKKMDSGKFITFNEAAGSLSYLGWMKNTDSQKVLKKYVYQHGLLEKVKKIVSNAGKERKYESARRQAVNCSISAGYS